MARVNAKVEKRTFLFSVDRGYENKFLCDEQKTCHSEYVRNLKDFSPTVRCTGMYKCRGRMDAQERRNDTLISSFAKQPALDYHHKPAWRGAPDEAGACHWRLAAARLHSMR